MKLWIAAAAVLAGAALCGPREARAFCGFYVGKADAKLFNRTSQVVMVRRGDKSVLTLMNDYRGEPSEFALVVPVPEVLQRGQIHIADRELIDKLQAYSAPRLVEYTDPDPCVTMSPMLRGMGAGAAAAPQAAFEAQSNLALGVTVEAQYTVGEYDIVILSAKQSDGLETWLQQNGYMVPLGAHRALEPYIRQGMKFFVAKVNLKEHQRTGLTYLRPIQFAFESPKFMLPIRLGMINAQGPQDLIVYALTESGRVETTNYRTAELPTGAEIPEYVRGEFGDFYKSLFDHQVRLSGMNQVFTEYVWNMGWCDPCAGTPLTPEELRHLGVFWLNQRPPYAVPQIYPPIAPGMPVMLTRLHVRYDAETFPEDLTFQETADRQNYQARYVMRHPWNGSPGECLQAEQYFRDLKQRKIREARNLADLTGWDVNAVMKKAGLGAQPRPEPWWKGLWD